MRAPAEHAIYSSIVTGARSHSHSHGTAQKGKESFCAESEKTRRKPEGERVRVGSRPPGVTMALLPLFLSLLLVSCSAQSPASSPSASRAPPFSASAPSASTAPPTKAVSAPQASVAPPTKAASAPRASPWRLGRPSRHRARPSRLLRPPLGAPGLRRATDEVSFGASSLRRATDDVSFGASGLRRATDNVSLGTSGLCRVTDNVSLATSGLCATANNSSRVGAAGLCSAAYKTSRFDAEELRLATTGLCHRTADHRCLATNGIRGGTANHSRRLSAAAGSHVTSHCLSPTTHRRVSRLCHATSGNTATSSGIAYRLRRRASPGDDAGSRGVPTHGNATGGASSGHLLSSGNGSDATPRCPDHGACHGSRSSTRVTAPGSERCADAVANRGPGPVSYTVAGACAFDGAVELGVGPALAQEDESAATSGARAGVGAALVALAAAGLVVFRACATAEACEIRRDASCRTALHPPPAEERTGPIPIGPSPCCLLRPRSRSTFPLPPPPFSVPSELQEWHLVKKPALVLDEDAAAAADELPSGGAGSVRGALLSGVRRAELDPEVFFCDRTEVFRPAGSAPPHRRLGHPCSGDGGTHTRQPMLFLPRLVLTPRPLPYPKICGLALRLQVAGRRVAGRRVVGQWLAAGQPDAARWMAVHEDQELLPYLIMAEPVSAAHQQRHNGDIPMEHILDFFNTWIHKAAELALFSLTVSWHRRRVPDTGGRGEQERERVKIVGVRERDLKLLGPELRRGEAGVNACCAWHAGKGEWGSEEPPVLTTAWPIELAGVAWRLRPRRSELAQ
ncbi:hypothetical protein HU200_001371 [Digitaria exilis]|uniref:Uncharacterized protein n=1 Tax=Digitaria exilis TaxID=1010633 RepID=A0A835L067_9POAL|nr:hypothetical protein HU200_001371 [Digitaria exilis]